MIEVEEIMPNNTYYSPDFTNTKGKGLGKFLAYLL